MTFISSINTFLWSVLTTADLTDPTSSCEDVICPWSSSSFSHVRPTSPANRCGCWACCITDLISCERYLLSHGDDSGVNCFLFSFHQLHVIQDLVHFLCWDLCILRTHWWYLHQSQSRYSVTMETASHNDTVQCIQVTSSHACTYRGDFAFDVLQQVFLSSDEERMLELCVIPFWFYKTPLLDVDHLPEAVWKAT